MRTTLLQKIALVNTSFLFMMMLAGCEKKLSPCFSYQSATAQAGNEINFTNCTDNAKGFLSSTKAAEWEWNFGDGTTGSGQYGSHVYRYEGVYSVTLTVKDEDGDGEGTVTQPVTIRPAGNVTLWTDVSADYLPITFTINGITESITHSFSTSPGECGAVNCANFKLPSGTYFVSGYDHYYNSYSGNYSFDASRCTLIHVQ